MFTQLADTGLKLPSAPENKVPPIFKFFCLRLAERLALYNRFTSNNIAIIYYDIFALVWARMFVEIS